MAGSHRITLRLGGSLPEITGCVRCDLILDEGVTLAELATQAGVSPRLVMLYSVNGTLRTADYEPVPGDEVLLIPAVAGGEP